jgi:hypothetical protein
MRVSIHPVSLALFALFLGLSTPGEAQTNETASAFRGKASALITHPFRVGDLAVTILEFKPNCGLTGVHLVFQIENQGPGFHLLSAEDLVIVERDGNQVLADWLMEDKTMNYLPRRLKIAPKAHLTLSLRFPFKSISLPAKLYFCESLLAEVVE